MKKIITGLLIGFGILFILGLAGGIAGYRWWKSNKSALIESAKSVIAEAGQFGATTDCEGCVDEMADRLKKDAGFKNQMKMNIFMVGCLQSSRYTPQFCDSVPPADKIMKTVAWRTNMCKKYGVNNNAQNVFAAVQTYCEKCRQDSANKSIGGPAQ
jgi:hypothetical protein